MSEGATSLLNEQPTNKYKINRWWLYVLIAAIAIGIVIGVSVYFASRSNANDNNKPVNVIIMISDGFGPASVTLGRECKKRLSVADPRYALDRFFVGVSHTYSSDSLVTDSAAGATAFSCALKTKNGYVAVTPQNTSCGTVLEAGVRKGYAVGLVATSTITHATPAAFSSHDNDRNAENDIAVQQLSQNITVMLGGGLSRFLNKSDPRSSRTDNRDLIAEAQGNGYRVLQSANDLRTLETNFVGKLLGLFATDQMSFDIDRDPNVQPSLKEMSATALTLLQSTNKPFFLMIEGSRIDHAGHANDVAAHVRDTLAYDEAVNYVLDLAMNRSDTLVISISDHETGGLSLGNINQYYYYPDVILAVKNSTLVIASALLQAPTRTNDAFSAVFANYSSVTNLTDTQFANLNSSFSSLNTLGVAVGHVIADNAWVAWTTTAHTGVDVNLYGYGPYSDQLRGSQENTHIGEVIINAMQISNEIAQVTADLNKQPKIARWFNAPPFSHGN